MKHSTPKLKSQKMTRGNIALVLTLSILSWTAIGFGAFWVAHLVEML